MAKKNTIMVVMLVLVAVMSIAYAYFSTNLTITTTGNISTEWEVKFTAMSAGDANGTTATNKVAPSYSETTATMSVDLKVPGDEMTYELTLSNTGTIGAIIEDISASATGSGAIIYSIDGIKIGDELAGGATKPVIVKIQYDPYVTSQPSETSKTLTVNIKAVQDTGQTITEQTPNVIQGTYLKSAILRDNTAYADNVASPYVTSATGIDFSKISSDTNGKGLYYTSTNTENNGTSYYFRGDVENNYVKFGTQNLSTCTYNGNNVYYYYVENDEISYKKVFMTESECNVSNVCEFYASSYSQKYAVIGGSVDSAEAYCTDLYGNYQSEKATYNAQPTEDILWRIVRINEDGSIRLVHSNAIINAVFTDDFEENNGSIVYNLSSSKVILDGWYISDLAKNSGYLSNVGFCQDFSGTRNNMNPEDYGYGPDDYVGFDDIYGAGERLSNWQANYKPQFLCPSQSLYNTSFYGPNKLTTMIGLLTADEVVYAGGKHDTTNSTYYLKGVDFYTMSPVSYSYYDHGSGSSGSIFAVSNNQLNTREGWSLSNESIGIRPAINLKSDTTITGGNGTSTNPYVVQTN